LNIFLLILAGRRPSSELGAQANTLRPLIRFTALIVTTRRNMTRAKYASEIVSALQYANVLPHSWLRSTGKNMIF
jgi:hypothetical protein